MEDNHEVIAIAAIGSKSRALGKAGDLIWKIPADLKHFRSATKGHPIIMGNKTYESLPKRPLPHRTNIVLTRDAQYFTKSHVGFGEVLPSNLAVATTPEEALNIAKAATGSEKIYIIGGGQIYKLMLPYTDTLDLTTIEEQSSGTQSHADTFFPEYKNEFSQTASNGPYEHEKLRYYFTLLKRNK